MLEKNEQKRPANLSAAEADALAERMLNDPTVRHVMQRVREPYGAEASARDKAMVRAANEQTHVEALRTAHALEWGLLDTEDANRLRRALELYDHDQAVAAEDEANRLECGLSKDEWMEDDAHFHGRDLIPEYATRYVNSRRARAEAEAERLTPLARALDRHLAARRQQQKGARPHDNDA